MNPLTDEEKKLASPMGDDTLLLRSRLDGREVAVMCHYEIEQSGDYIIHPFAILVTDEIFAALEQ